MQNINPGTVLRIILLSFFLMILSSIAYSQLNIFRGSIKDSSSLEPVAFATVFLDFKTGVIADEEGYFQIQIPAEKLNDTLKITCIGYSAKEIPVDHLKLFQNNPVYLTRNIYEIKSVIIKTKAKRLKKPEEIISEAISLIPENYSYQRVLYKGYYREYLKDGNDFVNLFESVLNLEDFGIALNYNFNANLEFKRLNEDFRFDSSLFKPYDNEEKYVPLAKVHLAGKNELAVLKSTDPIKNKFGFSVSYIDNFRKDFLLKHDFFRAKITYLNDRPFYVIPLKDNVNYTIGIERINMTGTIYIDAENYGVKKINYLATLHSSKKAKKLYELNVEYSLLEGTYYLHYISYNNLFKTSNFTFTEADIVANTLELTFNREINLQTSTPDNIRVLYNNDEQEIETTIANDNKLQVIFSDSSSFSLDVIDKTGSFSIIKNETSSEDKLSRLSIEFNGITDKTGKPLSSKPFNEYYQYREFFVHETVTGDFRLSSKTINMSKPVFESEPVSGGNDVNISWFNTPLIEESTEVLFPAR